jgi:hypothetical protein
MLLMLQRVILLDNARTAIVREEAGKTQPSIIVVLPTASPATPRTRLLVIMPDNAQIAIVRVEAGRMHILTIQG